MERTHFSCPARGPSTRYEEVDLLDDAAIERTLAAPGLDGVTRRHLDEAQTIISRADLRNETVLLSQYDPGRELEDLLMTKLVSTADRPRIERHDISRGIIKTLITIGFGISLVAESDIGVNFAGLTYREVRDGTGPSQVHYSAHSRKDHDNPALANLLRLLSERYPLPSAG